MSIRQSRFISWLLAIVVVSAIAPIGRVCGSEEGATNEKEPPDLIYFDLPKGPASDGLEAFGKVVDRPIVYRVNRVRGVDLNRIQGEMTLQEAMVALVLGTRLTMSEDKKTGAITVKVKSKDSQLGVRDAKKKLNHNTKQTEEMKTVQRSKIRSIFSMVGLGLIGSVLGAQEASLSDDGIFELDEFVVTATRREKPLQEVPVSVSAFGGLDIENRRIDELADLARYTPGFTASSFSNSSPIFAIRGANNTFSQAGASKPVGLFVNDVFIPRNSASDFNLFDIDQISVLRGPQGTLFGRNVTGGAIQITTAKPRLSENSLKTKISAGNLGYFEAAGAANLGVSEVSAFRFSSVYQERDGYITDRFNGQEYNDKQSLNLRGTFLFQPSEEFEVTLSADYSDDANNSRGYSLISNNAKTDFSDNDGDIRTAELDFPQMFERTIFGTSLKLSLDTDAGQLVSITAYRSSEAQEVYSLGAGAVALPSVSTQFLKDELDEPTSLSQELRFVSKENERFDFIAGLYYYDEDTNRTLNDVLLGVGGVATFFDRLYEVESQTESYAAYFDGTIHLNEQLDLNLGGRYTDEDKSIRVDFTDTGNPDRNFLVTPSNSFSEFTSRIALNWKASEDVNLFISRTEGFTAGGFNTETNSTAAIELGFDPETMTAYELGAKTFLLDRRLALNASLFSQKFEDKQEGFFNPEERFFSIFNASEATSQGLELEASYATSHSLSFHFGYSYLDTEYDSFVIPGGADFSGNQLQTAPENTFSFHSSYWKKLEKLGALNLNLGYSWQDDYFTGASNSVDFLIDGYGLVNASVGLDFEGRKSSVKIWANNLLDEDYLLIRGTSGAIGGYYGAPRTYGVSFVSEF